MDNLLRSRSQFKKLTSGEMRKPYGAGKETPVQILSDYEKQLEEIDASASWVKERWF